MNVTALAGGVGGAKLADGLARILAPEELTVVVNIGDDFDYIGLRVCPDLDTVCYTLAGLANPTTGWGRRDETYRVLESTTLLGAPGWFRIGDTDLATHLERTNRLRHGESLSTITREFCQAWGVGPRVLPASDQPVPTIVVTVEEGELPFQEYFVHRACQPRVTGFHFAGAEQALPAPGVIEAIQSADCIVLCPSNPWVSIDPILSIPGIRFSLTGKAIIAISPIIAGKALKGPAAKMYQELGITPSAASVASHYSGLLTGFVFDFQDVAEETEISLSGIIPYAADVIMRTDTDRVRLAGEVIHFAGELLRRESSR